MAGYKSYRKMGGQPIGIIKLIACLILFYAIVIVVFGRIVDSEIKVHDFKKGTDNANKCTAGRNMGKEL